MPRTAEQNQNIKDKRRAKLMAYALKVFAINGYDHTAIDDITKAARCSHGLFYHYFKSKEAVFASLIEEQLLGESELPVAEASRLGGTQGLRHLARYAERVASKGGKDLAVATITVFLDESKNLDDAGKAFLKEHDLHAALLTLIKQGQQEGKVIAGDAKDIAQCLVDMAKGGLRRLNTKDAASKRMNADVLYEFILKGPIED